MIFSKPPKIAYSRSENLRDSLVEAKFPTREEGDYLYDDLLRNEEDPPSSPTLQTLQDLELESKGFNVFIRAVASLTVPGGQEFHFPHFFLKFRSIFPQTLLIFFLILALRVGKSPTREGPGYATGVHRFQDNRGPKYSQRQDHKDHSSCPFQADTHGEIY